MVEEDIFQDEEGVLAEEVYCKLVVVSQMLVLDHRKLAWVSLKDLWVHD